MVMIMMIMIMMGWIGCLCRFAVRFVLLERMIECLKVKGIRYVD